MAQNLKLTIDPDKLAFVMAKRGLSIAELAKVSGRSRATLTYWLNARILNPKQASALAKALNVEVEDII